VISSSWRRKYVHFIAYVGSPVVCQPEVMMIRPTWVALLGTVCFPGISNFRFGLVCTRPPDFFEKLLGRLHDADGGLGIFSGLTLSM
jgi:hypothetical protein